MSVNNISALLPRDLGGKFCAFLDAPTYMTLIPRVCTTWNSYLSHFIADGHLNLKPFSWLNDGQFAQCLSLMRKRATSDELTVRSITLNLYCVVNKNRAVHALNYFPHLEQIDLGWYMQGFTDLAFLQKQDSVTSLTMGITSITEQSLNYLKHLPLKILEFNSSCINRIDALKDLPIEVLDMNYCGLFDSALTAIQNMPLVSLTLMGNPMRQFPVVKCDYLRTLDISHTRNLEPSTIETIALLPLTSLNLSSCLWLRSLSSLRTNTTLRILNLSTTPIQNQHLYQLPLQLTDLSLKMCRNITKVYPLEQLTQLRALNLAGIDRISDIHLIRRDSLIITQDDPSIMPRFVPTEEGTQTFNNPPALRRVVNRTHRLLFADV